MKIYTKTGDKGETGLIGGKRIPKSDQRIIAYGSVDELNSSVGLALSFLRTGENQKIFSDLIGKLENIQGDLFVVGSDLADPSYPENGKYKTPRVKQEMTLALEQAIDKFESELQPITFFILPGGSVEASFLHQCRSIARRAETAVASLSSNQVINPDVIVFLNRLSDFLFVSARIVNKRLGILDVEWKSEKK